MINLNLSKRNLVILVVVVIAVAAGVGYYLMSGEEEGAGEETITLKVISGSPAEPWHEYLGPVEEEENVCKEEHPKMYNALPVTQYEKEHDVDIKLEVEEYPYGDQLQAMKLAATSESTYDLIRTDDIWLGTIAATGYYSTEYSDEYKEVAEDIGLYDVFERGSSYEDEWYGIWDQTDTRAIWVWKDVLNEAGYTMEDISTNEGLLNTLPDINQTAKQEFDMSGGLEYPFNGKWTVDQWYGWMYQLGGSILKQEDGEWVAGFNNEAGYRTLEFVDDLEESGATFKDTWQWNLPNFLDRKYAMTYEGSWDISTINTSDQFGNMPVSEYDEHLGVIPTTTWKGEDIRVLTGGWMWCIPETANHPDVAFEINMQYLRENRDAYAYMLGTEGHFPTSEALWNNSIYKDQILKTMPESWFNRFREGVEGGLWRPFFPEYPQIQQELWNATQKVVLDQASPEEALSTAEQNVNDLMQED